MPTPTMTEVVKKANGTKAFCRSVLLTKVSQNETNTKPTSCVTRNHETIFKNDHPCIACKPHPSVPIAVGSKGGTIFCGIKLRISTTPSLSLESLRPATICPLAILMWTSAGSGILKSYSAFRDGTSLGPGRTWL